MDRKKRVALLQENYQLIKAGKERWQDKRVSYLMAHIYTEANKKYSDQKYRQLNDEWKQAFGSFHTLTKPTKCFLFSLSLSQEKMNQRLMFTLMNDYRRLRAAGFSLSTHSYFAAYILQSTDVAEKELIVNKAYDILKLMKKEHFFLTKAEDGVTAVMLAQVEQLDNCNVQEIADLLEQYYQALNEIGFYRWDELQIAAVAAALLTGAFNEAFVAHILLVINQLKALGIRLKGIFYSSVVTLAFLDWQKEINVTGLKEYLGYLTEKSDLRFYKETRQLLAINLLLSETALVDVNLSLLTVLVQLAKDQAMVSS